MKCKHIIIKGKVQGVFFRTSIKEKADELGVKGWVKNLSNENVEAIFCGEKSKIDQLIKFCEVGPLNAEVDSVEISDCEGNFQKFEILY
jgi:acylphosphatase